MSVRENLEIGAYRRTDAGAVLDDFERVLNYFPVLRERLGARAMALSGGQQQMFGDRPRTDVGREAAAAG